jgi:hypothetical protein
MHIIEALNIIELEDKSIVAKLQNARTFDEAVKIAEELHEIANKQRKVLAKKYHPDIGGDEEKFKKINDVCDRLLTIKPIKQPIVNRFTVIIRSSYESTATSTSYWTAF